jgi:hypothetical protein
MFVSDLLQIDGFLGFSGFLCQENSPPNITQSQTLLKVALNTIKPNQLKLLI